MLARLFYRMMAANDGWVEGRVQFSVRGGIFDIYGVAFVLDDGNAVNLWSNGVVPSVGLDYGVAITDRTNVLDYVGGVSIQAVPEPASWAIMLGGFGILSACLRSRRCAAMSS